MEKYVVVQTEDNRFILKHPLLALAIYTDSIVSEPLEIEEAKKAAANFALTKKVPCLFNPGKYTVSNLKR